MEYADGSESPLVVDALTRLCKLAALHFMTKRAGDFLRVRSDICIIIIAELFFSIHLTKKRMGICNLSLESLALVLYLHFLVGAITSTVFHVFCSNLFSGMFNNG